MKYKNLFWGVVLILLGVLFLLKKFDVIWFSWRDIFSLWPLILILWGISIIPVKSLYKLIASFLAILVMLLLIYYNPGKWHSGWLWIGDWHKSEQFESNKSELRIDSAEFALLELNAVAGSYVISGTSDQLVDFKHFGDSGAYDISTTLEDRRQHVRIGPKSKRNQFNIYRSHTVELKLNPDLVWDIDIDAGAADIELNLTPFIINTLHIDGGAASIEIKLGSLSDNLDVNIETGVSSVVIKVPKEVACEVNTDSFLVSKDLPDFDKVSKSTYVSPNFSSAEKNITIEFNSGISSLRVLRY
ncbi:MAG: hypothetical protein KAT76_03335 [Bacteroidales bacterium]|nr:hypothetical protein [Bacteroidales bacterium]